MNEQLKTAVTTIIYRESGRVTLSKVISTLRNQGWTKLGKVEKFAESCELSGFKVDYQYKVKNGIKVNSRTFISMKEDLVKNVSDFD